MMEIHAVAAMDAQVPNSNISKCIKKKTTNKLSQKICIIYKSNRLRKLDTKPLV